MKVANQLRTLALILNVIVGALIADAPSHAQTETVVAGEEYGTPPGGMFFFGKDYRDLWTAQIQVKELDLQSTAGGLKPVMRVGGMSSKGLAFQGADGRDYTFRSVNKDLTKAIPVEFQDSVLVDIVQDQVAGNVPGVAVIKPPLSRAVGLLAVDEARFVVLPDDPALGEFREDFAGVLGIFLEYPQPRSATNPGFHGATEILSPDDYWSKRQASTDYVPDTRQFLRARLLDMFLNDYDRHRKQWRWARIPGEDKLQPVPEDADMALTDYEGAAISMARFLGAPFVKFETKYPPLAAITKNGWDMDRLLLTDIEKPEWMGIAADVQSKLTDAVIEDAIRQLPDEYYNLRGGELVHILKSRRDQLTQFAERLYHYMARDVDVHGSNSREVANVTWLDSGGLRVTASHLNDDGSSGEPLYVRSFTADETKEVRIYLHGGDDKVVTSGSRTGGAKIRVIGGAGDDVVNNTAGGRVRFYDSEGDNSVEGEGKTHLDTREFTMPSRPLPNDVGWVPNQDWGRVTTPSIMLGYSSDPGVIVGGGIHTQGRGFRKYPWSTDQSIQGAWAFGASKAFIDYSGAIGRENSKVQFELNARYSGIEQLRYYGLGNETEFDRDNDSRYRIDDYQAELFPALVVSNDKRKRIAVGPYLQYSDSSNTDPNTVLAQEQPLGFGKFGYLGFRTEGLYDTRTGTDVFARGFEVNGTADYSFGAWNAPSAFGSVAGRFDAHLPTGSRLVWNLFAGGKKVWGDYPFFEAAYLDQRVTYGNGWNRYAGDAAVYGGVDLDIIVGKMRKMVPGDFGFSVFADTGRVYLKGEDSGKWHSSYGGGVFYAPFERTSLYALKVGVDDDRVFVVLEVQMSGFGF